MPIRFSKRRVYPDPPPILDPAKAPWSSPRKYATTIKEEADALKAAARAGKPPVKVVGGRAFLRSPGITRPSRPRTPNCFTVIGVEIRNLFRQVAVNFKVNSQKLVNKLFCINIDNADDDEDD